MAWHDKSTEEKKETAVEKSAAASGMRTRKKTSSAAGRVRLRARIGTAAVLIALVAAVFAFDSNMCYAVAINGEEVGYARDMADVDAVITQVEQQVSEILGYAYTLDDKISVSAELGKQVLGADAMEAALLDSVEGISQRYAVLVDGQVVGAVDSRGALDAMLDAFLSAYDAANVEFAQDVSVEWMYVSDAVTGDIGRIRYLLNPDNPASAYALTVICTDILQYTEAIPYDTEYVDDATIYEGDTRVTTTGVDGEMLITAKAIYENGEQVSFDVLSEYERIKPVTEVVAVGTGERPATASWGTYIWPADGVLTSYFGYRSGGVGSTNHKGLDIAGAYAQEIVAADGGEVIFAGWQSGYGNIVKIQHDNGDITYYAHCCELLVNEGERVAQGQQIAQMGSTGVSSGVHLHFEVHPGGGDAVDPLTVLP